MAAGEDEVNIANEETEPKEPKEPNAEPKEKKAKGKKKKWELLFGNSKAYKEALKSFQDVNL